MACNLPVLVPVGRYLLQQISGILRRVRRYHQGQGWKNSQSDIMLGNPYVRQRSIRVGPSEEEIGTITKTVEFRIDVETIEASPGDVSPAPGVRNEARRASLWV